MSAVPHSASVLASLASGVVLRGFLGALRALLWGQAGFGFRQRLFDQAQDEVPLGELYAGPSRFSGQVGLDALEEFLGNLECHRSAACHVDSSILIFHLVVFSEQCCDVLAGSHLQAVFFFCYPVVQGDVDLSA